MNSSKGPLSVHCYWCESLVPGFKKADQVDSVELLRTFTCAFVKQEVAPGMLVRVRQMSHLEQSSVLVMASVG